MSVFIDIAEEMKAAIEEVVPSSELAVIVDQQKKLASEFAKHIGKVKGGVAIIEFLSASSIDQDAGGPTLNAKYALTLWGKSIILEGAEKLPLDALLETICKKLHHHQVPNKHCNQATLVTDIKTINNEHYLIYQVSLTKQIHL
jgi:hypothetical protein